MVTNECASRESEITNNQVVTTVNRGKNTHQEYLSFNFFFMHKDKKEKGGFLFFDNQQLMGVKSQTLLKHTHILRAQLRV